MVIIMIRTIAIAALIISARGFAQSPDPDSFEVATIKPVAPDAKAGRFITMQGTHRFVGQQYTLKLLIAAAWNLNVKTISGGPGWMESDTWDIQAVTPGEARPTRDRQMAMLRNLLTDRFKLTFHRERREFSIYELQIAKGGPKLKASASPPDDPAALISTVYPQRMQLPARNATMSDLASLMQRAMLDRPVVDRTGLTGKYDFDLTWAPDETQFGGDVPVASVDAPDPPLFLALQQQLGLKLEPARGPVEALIVDRVERPSAN